MLNLKKFIKYNNLFIIVVGLCLMVILPLKVEIPWVSAAIKTGLGKAIVLIVPENVSVEEFLASLGLSESGDFRTPKGSGRIVSQEQRNAVSENIVLWLKDKNEDGILDTQDFSRYAQEINENGESLEITNDAMLFPTAYIGIEIWLKQAPSGILLKAGESYQIEIQGSTLYFRLNGESVGSLAVPFDSEIHQAILSFDGINVHLGLDGEQQQQFTPSFATLSRSSENLLVNPYLESLRILSQPMGEERFRDAYNELASNFGRENLMEERKTESVFQPTTGNSEPSPISPQSPQPDTIETIIDTHPETLTTSSDAFFAFHCDKEECAFQCQINNQGFTPCASPKEYVNLTSGGYAFEVFAVDPLGKYDPTPAVFSWTIDISTQPEPEPTTTDSGQATTTEETTTDSSTTTEAATTEATATEATTTESTTETTITEDTIATEISTTTEETITTEPATTTESTTITP